MAFTLSFLLKKYQLRQISEKYFGRNSIQGLWSDSDKQNSIRNGKLFTCDENPCLKAFSIADVIGKVEFWQTEIKLMKPWIIFL